MSLEFALLSAFGVLAATAVGAAIWQRQQALEARLAQVEAALDTLADAFTAALADRDARLARLDTELDRRALAEARRRSDRRPGLSQAIALSRQGLDSEALAETCGLPTGEACLIRRLHGPHDAPGHTSTELN